MDFELSGALIDGGRVIEQFFQGVKRFVKNWAGIELYEAVSRERKYRRLMRSGCFSRYGIDKRLEELMPYDSGFYVELGANDGALASNTYYFELKKRWCGVLIEPVPSLYLRCLKRRGKNNQVFCNACVPFGYKKDFVSMVYADSMTISSDLNLDLDDKDSFLELGREQLRHGEDLFRFGATPATLNDILLQSNAPRVIDFLSLDVEGAEFDVLNGVDFDKYSFKYMVIECRDILRMKEFLEVRGYSLEQKMTHHDYLFSKSKS